MKPLCKAPFIGMYWRGNRTSDKSYMGQWRSCCESMTSKYTYNAPVGSTFEEIYNNPIATEIRDSLSKGLWHPNCMSCKERERQFGRSAREQYNNLPYEEFAILDYRPSNLCNLKCRMCNGMHSSLLATEEGATHYFYDKKSQKHDLPVDWSKIKKIKILGGEPMVMEETIDVLNRLSEDCLVQVTTNAYKLSHEVEKALLETKSRVQINLSIDGVGDTYNYIRIGSNWNQVEENVIKLLSYNKFEMSVNPVAMMWNVFGLNDLFDWCLKHNIRQNNLHWVGESWNRINLLTDKHKEQVYHPKIAKFLNETVYNKDKLLIKWREVTNTKDLLRGTDITDLDERYVDYL